MSDDVYLKLLAPFSGIDDLGVTARYQQGPVFAISPEVTLVIEGSPTPLSRLLPHLETLSRVDTAAHRWSPPFRLADALCLMGFRSCALELPLSAERQLSMYLHHQLEPALMTFLRDLVALDLRLSEELELAITLPGRPPTLLSMQRSSLTPYNGHRTLMSL